MTLADMFNAPGEFALRDEATDTVETFRMREPNQLEQGEFQRWLEQLAFDNIASRKFQTEADREAALRVWQHDCAAGVYEYGGVVCIRRLTDPNLKGLAKLMEIVCRDQGMTHQKATAIARNEQIRLVALISKQATDDPKALEAVLNRLGLPSDFFSSNSATPPSAAPTPSSRSDDSATAS